VIDVFSLLIPIAKKSGLLQRTPWDDSVNENFAPCFLTEENVPIVLIAEDNAVNRELLRELLQARGYAVVEASNGQEALEMMSESKPDVLLIDLNMPVLDGYATLKKIREDPALNSLPVIAVTASAMRGDQEKGLEAGFDCYLSKPIQSSVLYGALERVLGTKSRS
jgi:two-component system, cell cycle response regulator DivK